MRPISPISRREFAQMLRQCAPPIGLQTKIAVANSGGPDSTCLLFLLTRYVAEEDPHRAQELPTSSVVSLTVDHGLQAASRSMAERCAKTATSLGVDHITMRIPWSSPPFPALPSQGESFEGVARNARYHVLFQTMLRLDTKIIAFGHHADDQVETSLMRLGRHTTELGAAGMRRCRRWGMGSGRGPGSLGWVGHEGMNRWILRPLLDVSKDRILATCEENGLEYVNDPTNFQQEITLRNAVRQLLLSGHQRDVQNHPSPALPIAIAEQLEKIKTAARSLQPVGLDLAGGREQLRTVVKRFSSHVDDIDRQVDSHLEHYRRPSPPGTFLLSAHGLSAISHDTVRAAMILRIMRYTSFHPWGSLRADAQRRRASIQQIVEKIWDSQNSLWQRKPFTAGGGVLWTPLARPFVQERTSVSGQSQELVWLASRQPPLHPDKILKQELHDPLHLHLTSALVEWIESPEKQSVPFSILYDCRFLLQFNLDLAPEDMIKSIVELEGQGSVIVQPHTRWYLPRIVWRRSGKEDVILESRVSRAENSNRDPHLEPDSLHEPIGGDPQRWIRIQWVRSLEAA